MLVWSHEIPLKQQQKAGALFIENPTVCMLDVFR